MATETEKLLLRVEAQTKAARAEMQKLSQSVKSSSAKMQRSMKGPTMALRGFEKQTSMTARLVKTKLVAAIAAVAAPAALGALISRSISAADSIAKVADKVGFTTDQLQELRFAAEQAGVGANTLDMALQRFSRRLGEAAQGSGELYDTLKQYNIGVLDSSGKTRANIDVLNDLSDAIKGAKSQQEALRIGFKAFDSEGAALVNMLRGGSTALDNMRAKAQAMGVVMSADLIRKGEDARSKLDALWAVLSSKLNIAMVKLAPVILKVAEALFKVAAQALKAFENFSKFLGLVDREIGEKLTKVEKRIVEFNRQTSLGKWLNPTEQKEYNALLAERARLLNELGKKTATSLDPFGGSGPNLAPKGGSVLPGKKTTTTGSSGTTKKSGEDILARAQERIHALELERQALALTGEQLTAFKFQNEALAQARAAGIELTAEQEARLEALSERYAALGLNVKSATKAQQESAERMQAFNDLVVNDVVGGGFDALNSALEGNKEAFKDWGKSILAAIRQVIVQTLVLKAIQSAMGSIGGGGGGFLGSLFGGGGNSTAGLPGMATGGPVSAGQPYMVGEKGPEMFVPSTSGSIVPNNKMGAGGDTYYVDATGASRSEFEKFKAWAIQQNARVEERALTAQANRRARALA